MATPALCFQTSSVWASKGENFLHPLGYCGHTSPGSCEGSRQEGGRQVMPSQGRGHRKSWRAGLCLRLPGKLDHVPATPSPHPDQARGVCLFTGVSRALLSFPWQPHTDRPSPPQSSPVTQGGCAETGRVWGLPGQGAGGAPTTLPSCLPLDSAEAHCATECPLSLLLFDLLCHRL